MHEKRESKGEEQQAKATSDEGKAPAADEPKAADPPGAGGGED